MNKAWLVYYTFGGECLSREDASVFYSWIVDAPSKEEAINKVIKHLGEDQDPINFNADEHEIIR